MWEQGEVKEFGEPWELLGEMNEASRGGWFRGMVAGTGAENEIKLTQASRELYESRRRNIG